MYSIELVKESIKRNQVVAIHIMASLVMIMIGVLTFISPLTLNIMAAGRTENKMAYTWINYSGLLIALIGILIIILTVFFNKKYIQHKKNLIIRLIEISVFIPILVFTLMQAWYLPAIYSGTALIAILLAYYLETRQSKARIIQIDDKGILLKTSSKNTFWKWSFIEHFIIRHNVMTLRTTEKKMYQFIFVTEAQSDYGKITAFATEKINEAIPQRHTDNW